MRQKLTESQVTPPQLWEQRRDFIKTLGSATLLGLAPSAWADTNLEQPKPTAESLVTHYNNYYEFSFEKEEPAQRAGALKTSPWTIEVGGQVEKPLRYDIQELIAKFHQVERIYRFRCVEGWSAILPWQGIPLNEILQASYPLSSAKYVAFIAVTAPEAMPNQRSGKLLAWPYREALRIDEAMHPLTLMATGMYGHSLAPQNGAPIRLVVPWKYGFKSIKAVIRIELLESKPTTTWNLQAPEEYGFFANVNPNVPHPRWSQATERPLGSGFFQARTKTQLFNGYAEDVASLYTGLDLKRNF